MSTPLPAPTRSRAGTLSGPHALSLKVLRLSRPTLATHTPLPTTHFGHGLDLAPAASLAYPHAASSPSADPNQALNSATSTPTTTFPLTPLLTLPSAFGAAYVGETFACTLCANHEVSDGARAVRDVRIVAELQTPSSPDGVALALSAGEEEEEDDDDDDDDDDEEEEEEEDGGEEGKDGEEHKKDGEEKGEGKKLEPGRTLQRTLRHELKDEGPHVLAVTVTYTERNPGGAGKERERERTRTVRKLYQFVAQQLVAVRSKVTERKKGEDGRREWVLEAQLENVGESSVVVEKVALNEREGIRSRAISADTAAVLKPQDVEQVMFVVEEAEKTPDAPVRVPLAQMHIEWRSAMGDKGSLTTGWLASRGR